MGAFADVLPWWARTLLVGVVLTVGYARYRAIERRDRLDA